MPVALSVGPIVEVIALFAVIKWHSVFPILGVCSFVLIFCVQLAGLLFFESVAAQVMTRSEELLTSWRRNVGIETVKRKYLKSFKPMKVTFASNYVDKLTVLVTQDFCLNQIVSLLIMYQ